MVIKLDIDKKYWTSFDKWLRHFESMYSLLRIKNTLVDISNTEVFRTKNGWHIYIYDMDLFFLYNNEVNLLECLLGSDLFKQGYYFLEGHDILFRSKNGRKEKFDKVNQGKLNKAVKEINAKNRKQLYVYMKTF